MVLHRLFELIWHYRFLYRDLNDLLSKNRRLEMHFQALLGSKARAIQALLGGLGHTGAVVVDVQEAEATTYLARAANLLAEL